MANKRFLGYLRLCSRFAGWRIPPGVHHDPYDNITNVLRGNNRTSGAYRDHSVVRFPAQNTRYEHFRNWKNVVVLLHYNRHQHIIIIQLVLTLRAKGAAALWAVVRMVVRAAGVSGTGDEITAGTTVASAGGGSDVPRDDVSSGRRCCLARR